MLEERPTNKGEWFAITLLPDDQIFECVDKYGNTAPVALDHSALRSILREAAYLNLARKVSLLDYRPEADSEREDFQYEGGISQYAEYLNEDRKKLHEPPIHFSTTVDGIYIEFAIQWTDLYSQSIYSFVNGVSTAEGGTHLCAFTRAVRRTLTDYGKNAKIIPENEMLLYFEDFAEGAAAIINVRLEKPMLTGKTLEYLSNPELSEPVQTFVSNTLYKWLQDNPATAERIIKKGLDTADYNRKYRR